MIYDRKLKSSYKEEVISCDTIFIQIHTWSLSGLNVDGNLSRLRCNTVPAAEQLQTFRWIYYLRNVGDCLPLGWRKSQEE
jgi:hypothetical protein